MVFRFPKRFHLFTAMLLVAVFAVALAGIVRPFFAQRQAVAKLSGRGFDLRTEPSWLSRLTRQAVFDRVVGVSPAIESSPITVEDARSLESLPYLRTLALDGRTDDELPRLYGLTRLKRLVLYANAHCTEPGLICLLEHLPELESLSIVPDEDHPPLSDAGLAALARLPRFRNLEVYEYDNVSDAGLAHLKAMTGIEVLDLADEPITDAGLAHLSGLSTIRSLRVSNTPVTDAGLAHLRGLNRLEDLSLEKTRINDAGLVHLKGLPLEGLSLAATDVTDAGMAELSGIKSLVRLRLYRTKVTDAGLARLRGLPKLKSLDLRETQVSEAGIKALRRARPGLWVRR
jgi:Leucine-rich repeat (LRR) protein